MTPATATKLATPELAPSFAPPAREIVFRTRGSRHGPITRLVSPGDLGQVLKPFVFLDHFDTGVAPFRGFGLHPHSGIATVTYLFEGNIRYEDTTGAQGELHAGSVEWFKAAHGAWHGGGPGEAARTRGFQLWIALPPADELGAVESIYQAPEAVPQAGPARVVLGSHEGVTSPLKAPGSINYLAVRLAAGQSWRYQPAPGHTVGWVALASGRVLTPAAVKAGELAIFEPSNTAIDFTAEEDSEFVVGSAAPHGHDLALGNYSVHTSQAKLAAGEQRIREIGQQLRSEGRL